MVPFVMLRDSKLPFSKFFSCLCNCIVFICEVGTKVGGLPAWLDGA
jgi:hypothetical protein